MLQAGHRAATARAAALVLTSENPQASVGIQLLRDLEVVFGTNDEKRREDIAALIGLPERRHFHADGNHLPGC